PISAGLVADVLHGHVDEDELSLGGVAEVLVADLLHALLHLRDGEGELAVAVFAADAVRGLRGSLVARGAFRGRGRGRGGGRRAVRCGDRRRAAGRDRRVGRAARGRDRAARHHQEQGGDAPEGAVQASLAVVLRRRGGERRHRRGRGRRRRSGAVVGRGGAVLVHVASREGRAGGRGGGRRRGRRCRAPRAGTP